MQSGKPVTSFSVATSRGTGDKEETEWHSVVTWDKTADACRTYLTKGQIVYVEGRIQTRSWDKDDGTKAYKTEIVADRVLFLSPKAGAAGESEVFPDEMPF